MATGVVKSLQFSVKTAMKCVGGHLLQQSGALLLAGCLGLRTEEDIQLISVIPEYNHGIEAAVSRLPVNGFILHRRGEKGRHGDSAAGTQRPGIPAECKGK